MARTKRTREADEENQEFDMMAVDQDAEQVNALFEFFEPVDTDFHGVKPLLSKAFAFQDAMEPLVCLTQLTDTICNQGNIGSVVKAGDGDTEMDTAGSSNSNSNTSSPHANTGSASTKTPEANAFCVTTILNTRQYQKEMDLSGLVKWLKKHDKKAEASQPFNWETLIQGSDHMTGFLVNERVLNLPNDLVPPLHEQLVAGIQWSQTTPECPAEERPFYSFQYFFGLAQMFRDKEGDIYPKFEEEVYIKDAVYVGEPVFVGTANAMSSNRGNDTNSQEFRVPFVIEASKLQGVVDKIKAFKW